ncbi:42324_t:CDS:1, partial [Gigaspora margarita]
ELIEEKNQPSSLINKLMNDNEQTGSIKKCLVCQTSNINNKKQLYPNCNTKLPTINELKLLNEPLEVANNTEKSYIFTSYTFNKLDKQIALKNKTNIPQIFIPDPKNINPNSVANLKKILDHIEEISGIKENKHK